MTTSPLESLADELRLKITLELDGTEKDADALVEDLASSQVAVAKGLKVLLASGFLQERKVGNKLMYSLTDLAGRQAIGLVEWHRHTANTVEIRLAQLKQDRLYEKEMNGNPCPVLITGTSDGRILYRNLAALAFFEAKGKERMLGKDVADFVKLLDRRLKVIPDPLDKNENAPRIRQTTALIGGLKKKVEVTSTPTYIFGRDVMVSLILPMHVR